jgi:hypothetical protein
MSLAIEAKGVAMRLKRILNVAFCLGLMACSSNAAMSISRVSDDPGYDESSMSGFRSTGVTKSFDVDGDHVYGTAGTFFFGLGGGSNISGQPFSRHTDNLPSWVSGVAAGTNFGSVAEYDTYSLIDDPTLASTNDVADWARSAIGLSTLGGVGTWSEIMTFTVDETAPSAFCLGIMAGNEGNTDGRWDPTGLRLSVDGGTAVAATNLPIVNSTVGMVFFNITTDGTVGTISVEGQQRLSGQGPSLAGLTFDVSTNGVFQTLPEIEYFVVAQTDTEGLGKVAWSVENATTVSLLNVSNETVAGVSGLQGTADITYTSGDTFTLVATSNGVQRTETQTITTTISQEDEVTFTFDSCTVDSAPGSGVGRRDPSDVIVVGDTWHVWYSRMTNDVTTGYDASVWHATSTNGGYHWVEQAEAVPRGTNTTDWDCTSTFTPNIVFHDGTYYLYYTAVGPNFTQDYEEEGKTGIGVATSSSPYGPWTKHAGNPVLIPSTDTSKFDSFRVDDSCLAVRDGNVWLYYKGRPWGYSASYTKMGVAVATNGVGPFVKQNDGDPVQLGGHEVQIWADADEGIYSMVNGVGSTALTYTIQYAADGLNFTKYADISTDEPGAPGLFRQELTDPAQGCQPDWGVYGTRQLGRYELDFIYPGELRVTLEPAAITEGNRMGDSVGVLSVSGGADYGFELLPIINTNDFSVESAAVTANTVFDSSVTNQVGLFVRASLDDSTVDAYFDVDVLEASGIQGWRLDEFGADVLAQTNLEATVWGDDANPDGDAFSNSDEYSADTLPQDSNSLLRVESLLVDGSSLELSWIGGVQATQYVESCSALTSNTVWTVVATNLPPTAVSNVWNRSVLTEETAVMFRIRTER